MSQKRRPSNRRPPKTGSQPRRGPRPGQPAARAPTGIDTIRSAFTGGGRRAATAYALVALLVSIGVVVVLLVVLQGKPVPPAPSPSASASAAAVTPLAPVPDSVTGQAIDGIQCQSMEQVAYHIHAHLAIYVNGQQRSIPEGIGIPSPRTETQTAAGPFVSAGSCYYWLHAHTDDGIIHIEAPTQQLYTLGDWFDIWAQPLSGTQVGPASGTVIAYVDGQRYTGDIRGIQLTAHELIQLDVGQDVAPQPFTFPAGL